MRTTNEKKNKIGVLAQYLDSRHDIREFINELSIYHEIVVYLRPQDTQLATLLSAAIEIRIIQAKVKGSIWNNILIVLYKLFGVLPASKHNYFITEFFKLNHARLKGLLRFKESTLLQVSRITPKFISYDAYLKFLRYNKTTNIEDIDEFVCFTQIYDDLFFAHILQSDKPTKVYVYSWDHPCKMKTFSKRVSEYLVWNEGLKEDLILLQGIEKKIIRIFGATQLTYIKYFQEKIQNAEHYYDFKYLYFACATGYPKLVEQEVEVICKTASFLAERYPELKLVVRTYPFFGAEELYEPLNGYSNVVIDDYKSRIDTKKESLKVIMDKLVKISQSEGLIHFGTTFGLEAAYFEVPVILADIVSDYKELNEFVHQYQNDKYLNLKYKNIPKSWNAYEQALDLIFKDKPEMMMYNKDVASTTHLYSMNELASQL